MKGLQQQFGRGAGLETPKERFTRAADWKISELPAEREKLCAM